MDTSTFISFAAVETLDVVLFEFDVHTPETVITGLETTAEYAVVHGNAASKALDSSDDSTVHQPFDRQFTSSRIDDGEGNCLQLTGEIQADFLITDDLRALPELQALTDSRVGISPLVLRALVKRDGIDKRDALERVNQLADIRDWLGSQIYRRAKRLFE